MMRCGSGERRRQAGENGPGGGTKLSLRGGAEPLQKLDDPLTT